MCGCVCLCLCMCVCVCERERERERGESELVDAGNYLEISIHFESVSMTKLCSYLSLSLSLSLSLYLSIYLSKPSRGSGVGEIACETIFYQLNSFHVFLALENTLKFAQLEFSSCHLCSILLAASIKSLHRAFLFVAFPSRLPYIQACALFSNWLTRLHSDQIWSFISNVHQFLMIKMTRALCFMICSLFMRTVIELW